MVEVKCINKWISVTRGLAIILVVMGHAIIPSIRGESKIFFFLWNVIYSFHMFLYFLLSGYLFQQKINKYKEDKYSFISRKFMLLIVPYITLTFIEYGLLLVGKIDTGENILAILGLKQVSFVAFLKALLLYNGHYDTHLWFIYALFFIFLINIIFPEVSSRKKYLFFILVCSGLYPVLGIIDFPIKTIMYWSVPFFIGRKAFVYNWDEKIAALKRRKIFGMLIVFILTNSVLGLMDAFQGKMSIGMAYVRVGITYELKHITGILGSIILIWFVNKIINKRISNVATLFDKYSYDVYIIHQPFITVGIATVLLKIGINNVLVVITTTCFALITSILISKYIVRKSKVLRILLVGNH